MGCDEVVQEGLQPLVGRYTGSFVMCMGLCRGDSALFVEFWRVHVFAFLRQAGDWVVFGVVLRWALEVDRVGVLLPGQVLYGSLRVVRR